jgi:DNA-binding MarR family transcriptional regulator
MTSPTSHNAINSRRVASAAYLMTQEEKVKLISSVYSNLNKIKVAEIIREKGVCTNHDLHELTGIKKNALSTITNDMIEAGVLYKAKDSKNLHFNYFSLTEKGKKLLLLVDKL